MIPRAGPSITQNTVRNGSANTFFNPIPADFLFANEASNQVKVVVNDISAVCQAASCGYTIDETIVPTVTAFTVSGRDISITLSNPVNGYTFTQNMTTVFMDEYECVITSWSITSIACTTVHDIYAGDYKPKVHFYGLGYALYDSSVTDFTTALTVDSLAPSAGSTGGLCEITATGTGFPSLPHAGLVVKVGALVITDYKLISSTQLSFFTPA